MTKKISSMLIIVLLFSMLISASCGSIGNRKIDFDTRIEGSLSKGDETTYTFDVEAGQHVFFEMLETNGGELQIVCRNAQTDEHVISGQADTNHDILDTVSYFGPLPGVLKLGDRRERTEEDRQYTLKFSADDDQSVDYAFIIKTIDPVYVEMGELPLDQVVSNSIQSPGQSIYYELPNDGTPSRFLFEALSLEGGSVKYSFEAGIYTFWEFNSTSSRVNRSDNDFTTGVDGPYYLKITAFGPDTPDFSFIVTEIDY